MSAEAAVEDLEEKAEAMLEDAAIIGILFGVMAAVALISALVSAQKFSIKGTVSRDFLLLVFFMHQFPPSPRVSH